MIMTSLKRGRSTVGGILECSIVLYSAEQLVQWGEFVSCPVHRRSSPSVLQYENVDIHLSRRKEDRELERRSECHRRIIGNSCTLVIVPIRLLQVFSTTKGGHQACFPLPCSLFDSPSRPLKELFKRRRPDTKLFVNSVIHLVKRIPREVLEDLIVPAISGAGERLFPGRRGEEPVTAYPNTSSNSFATDSSMPIS